MNITLARFQIKAIKALLSFMDEPCRDIILKSPTGSGKTIILTHFMAEYIRGNADAVFVWLTPGKGNLEEQSRDKMNRYIHGASAKLLSDVMTSGFAAGDCCFINWEKLTKKGNNALKESERTNFVEWIQKALSEGLKFKVIIDESHQNFTEKSDAIVKLFGADKIIRCSATPLADKRAKNVEVPEEDVIAEGLIKKMLVINEDFPQVVETLNQTEYLLERALDKQRELRSLFASRGKDINPLIIVQLPNNSDELADTVERFFFLRGITCGAGNLSVWLSARHENISDISENNAKTVAVIIKQAVATGWDCPRAYILVKLRENMDETFEVQTVGRIRRMPEATHYDDDALDSCYLYTFDGKFTQGVKSSLGKAALEAKTLFLKNAHKSFSLVKQQRTSVTDIRDSRKTFGAVAEYYKSRYSLTGDKKLNIKKLEENGYIFSESIVRYSLSGKVVVLEQLSQSDKLNAIELMEPLNTHTHGREYLRRVGELGVELGMKYAYANTLMARLFGDKPSADKFTELSVRELYAFVINNFAPLKRDFTEATSDMLAQMVFAPQSVSEKQFTFPRSALFTYDEKSKGIESRKNVYDGYLLSAEPRTACEKAFEKFCETYKKVDWIYKNGDNAERYFSLVYNDNNRQKLFYPDYILSVGGRVWIIATEGEGIRQKLEVLKSYARKYGLCCGLVRHDVKTDELYVCTDEYSDADTAVWRLLAEVFE